MYTNKCKWCEKDIEVENSRQFGGHVTNCLLNIDRINRLELKRKNDYDLYKLSCIKCNNTYELYLLKKHYTNGKYKKYCSRVCANSRIITEEHKLKTCMSLMKNDYCSVFFIKCKNCNKISTSSIEKSYCNTKCLGEYRIELLKIWGSKGGLKSVEVQSKNRRSKNEIYFSELCIDYFKDVECNRSIFNGWDADIIIHDIKYCILWNGKWHYEKITKEHSVEQVQNRDKIKISEIIKYGYTPYIIKDMGRYNKKFVKNEFNIFLNSFLTN